MASSLDEFGMGSRPQNGTCFAAGNPWKADGVVGGSMGPSSPAHQCQLYPDRYPKRSTGVSTE